MKANHIYIKNFMGISEVQITPGAITHLKGQNGVGKSSVLEALKFVFKAKSNPLVIHGDSDKAEVILELDNNYELSRVQKASGTKLDIRNGTLIQGKPQDWINSIVDLETINPLDLIYSKPKERLEIVLSAMPVKLDVNELEAITGVRLNNKGNAFDYVNDIRKVVFDNRTSDNVLKKEKEHALKQLREQVASFNIPDNLEQRINDCDKTMDGISKEYNESLEKHRNIYKETTSVMEKERDAELEAIRVKYATKSTEYQKILTDVTQVALEKYNSTFYTVKEEKAVFSKMLEQQGALANTNKMIYQLSEQANEYTVASEIKTEILNRIDGYKKEMISQIPIPGLYIENDNVFYNGVEFSLLNTATQILLAVDIACLKMGEYKLLFIDGVERLDAKNLLVLEGKINSIGAQAFLASVTSDEEIVIDTKGGMF